MKLALAFIFAIHSVGFSKTLYFDFNNDDHLNWAICEDIHAEWIQAEQASIDGIPVDFERSIFAQRSHLRPRINIYLRHTEPIEIWRHYDRQLKILNGAFRLSERPDNLHAFLKNLRDNGIRCRIIFDAKGHESEHIVFQAGPIYVFDPPSVSEALQMMYNPIGDRFYNRLVKKEAENSLCSAQDES